ncbi:hypothetical protein [Dyadobacter sp. CY323]|uniref:hypothetical protein n=1 Tax=Dyadobacter sp. CY323 TaxID=2907302 RepID=UPI001F2ECC74|nr:hypothetical protein [Dyadobacter sp. CY323]MCE6989504.1 hypothetical protein [Dyadobacter sp. CY323]
MDVIIFLKAVSNLLFAAILLLAVVVSSTFSIVFYAFKGIKPNLGNLRTPLFKRRLS